MGVEGSKFNVCVTAGPDAPDMLFRFKIKDGSVTVGQVIDAVTDEIQAGLGDEHYDYEWDGEVTGLVPYFGDDWDNLPEGALLDRLTIALLRWPGRQPCVPVADYTMEQIWADSDMDGADGELYVIGVCATDGWTDEEDELAQIDYWKDTDFEGTEWYDLRRADHNLVAHLCT